MRTPTIPETQSAVPWRMAAPLRQQVVQLIRDSIVAGEYRPGQRLIERVLCERHQVSRTVVREALRQLESEGLVTVEPNRGPVVTTLSDADVADLYEAREAIESAIARLFAERATAVQRRKLEERFEALELAARNVDFTLMISAKDDYYEVLLDGAASGTLRRLLDSIHSRTKTTRGLSLHADGRAPRMLEEMRALTVAAVSGDGAGAAAASAAHVRAAGAAAREILRVAAKSRSDPEGIEHVG